MKKKDKDKKSRHAIYTCEVCEAPTGQLCNVTRKGKVLLVCRGCAVTGTHER